MSNPKVSIIIPHWNGIEILSECLDSLTQTEYSNKEIIVVDNASTDGSSDWVNINYPSVKLIENDQNYGYAGGCNRGANAATGDYLTFLNNDTIKLEKVRTTVSAIAITMAISTLTVTAKAEQTPKTCLVIGLLSINGSENIFFAIILSS